MKDIAVSDAFRPFHVVNVLDALNIHSQPFQAVSYLNRDGLNVLTADLLKIRELRYFHAVEPNFPAKSPRA